MTLIIFSTSTPKKKKLNKFTLTLKNKKIKISVEIFCVNCIRNAHKSMKEAYFFWFFFFSCVELYNKKKKDETSACVCCVQYMNGTFLSVFINNTPRKKKNVQKREIASFLQ